MTEHREQEFAPIVDTQQPHASSLTDLADVAAGDAGQAPAEKVPAAAVEEQHDGMSNGSAEPSRWHVEAGRKGAERVHQLIQKGKLYEQEHGLKSGRQRLRQLIQEGRLYEREHGLEADGDQARQHRPVRMSSEQVLLTFFQALLRLAKPSLRKKLLRTVETLESDNN
jgi:hypothetical protein